MNPALTETLDFLGEKSPMIKEYIGQTVIKSKKPVRPTAFRERVIERITRNREADIIDVVRKHIMTLSNEAIFDMVQMLLDDGAIEPSEMLYTRIDEPVMSDAGLSRDALALFAVLSSYCYWPKHTCSPSIDTLRHRLGTDRSHIIKWRRELEERGHLSCTSGRGQQRNVYCLLHRVELVEAERARTNARIDDRKRRKQEADAA